MPSVERILVAVDLSPCAHAAFRYAAFLTHRLGADLGIIHVQESAPDAESVMDDLSSAAPGEGAEDVDDLGGRPRHITVLLEYIARCLLGPGDWAIQAMVDRGDPAEIIRRTVRQEKYDILVVGRHGQHSPSGLGRVARELLDESPCPVIPVWVSDSGAQPIARVDRSQLLSADSMVRRYEESRRLEADRYRSQKAPAVDGGEAKWPDLMRLHPDGR